MPMASTSGCHPETAISRNPIHQDSSGRSLLVTDVLSVGLATRCWIDLAENPAISHAPVPSHHVEVPPPRHRLLVFPAPRYSQPSGILAQTKRLIPHSLTPVHIYGFYVHTAPDFLPDLLVGPDVGVRHGHRAQARRFCERGRPRSPTCRVEGAASFAGATRQVRRCVGIVRTARKRCHVGPSCPVLRGLWCHRYLPPVPTEQLASTADG